MTHPQVFGLTFTPIRRFLALKTHPFWPHIPNMTQYGSAAPPPPRGKEEELSSSNVQLGKLWLRYGTTELRTNHCNKNHREIQAYVSRPCRKITAKTNLYRDMTTCAKKVFFSSKPIRSYSYSFRSCISGKFY